MYLTTSFPFQQVQLKAHKDRKQMAVFHGREKRERKRAPFWGAENALELNHDNWFYNIMNVVYVTELFTLKVSPKEPQSPGALTNDKGGETAKLNSWSHFLPLFAFVNNDSR